MCQMRWTRCSSVWGDPLGGAHGKPSGSERLPHAIGDLSSCWTSANTYLVAVSTKRRLLTHGYVVGSTDFSAVFEPGAVAAS
jgi:hypothetical protein